MTAYRPDLLTGVFTLIQVSFFVLFQCHYLNYTKSAENAFWAFYFIVNSCSSPFYVLSKHTKKLSTLTQCAATVLCYTALQQFR